MKRRKLLLVSGVVVLTIGFLTFSIGAYSAGKANSQLPVSQVTTTSQPDVYGLFTDVNQQRVANGLTSLTLDPRLNTSASEKCADMAQKNYWAHVSPSGVQPWYFIDAALGSKPHAAENLYYSKGHGDTDVVSAWINSPEHRANILDGTLTAVGYAVCSAPIYQNVPNADIVVQHFATE